MKKQKSSIKKPDPAAGTVIAGYRCHPAASLFPLMPAGDLDKLAEDIRKHGQSNPCLVWQDQVLDGRNRLLACELAGRKARVEEWDGQGSAVTAILSRNLHRRHLTESQRAMVAALTLDAFRAEAKERQRRGPKGSATWRDPGTDGKATQVAAAVVGVGPRSIERAVALTKKAPELVERVKAGEITLGQAERETKHAAARAAIQVYKPPQGCFNVIVADVPWKYRDELEGDGARGGLPYPPMELDEICALEIPADKDAALWFWVTNPMLLDGSAFKVLAAWKFEPRAMLTWDKEKMGTGHWLRGQTEHCILATRGRPVICLTNETTIIREPRREHSRKPEAFWRLVESLCPGKARLEMFAREARPGWVTSGAEMGAFKR